MDNLIKKYKARELSFKTPIAAKWFALLAAAIPNTFYASGPKTDIAVRVDRGAWAIVQEIASVYCGSLFLLFLAIDVLVLAFSKNEKAISIAKGSLVAILVCYVVFKLIENNSIKNSMEVIGNWF